MIDKRFGYRTQSEEAPMTAAGHSKFRETVKGRRTTDAGAGDPDFMTSLARGLAVFRCFAEQRKPMTIAQTSQRTGIPRASVRRCLHTLVKLGYAVQDLQYFSLQSKTLSLGYAYLSSNRLPITAQPLLDQLREGLRESCSLAVRDGDEICYVARSEAGRILSTSLRVGSRLPLYCTSMGRVLLSHCPVPEQRKYLARTPLLQRTSLTQVDSGELLEILVKIRRQGYAVVDQELELGLRSIAVPVTRVDGNVVAAVNVGTRSTQTQIAMFVTRFLPALRQIAGEIAL
jgi:IclR family pca regulon transcriptional regulator